MPNTDLDILHTAVKRHWSLVPSRKAKPYVNAFFAARRRGTNLTAKVVGNHGTYTVSIQVEDEDLTSACSCYIGKYGNCHHCAALAITFLNDPTLFKVVKQTQVKQVRTLDDVRTHLQSMTLDALLKELKAQGMTQKAFAESIGMNTRHLSAIKSSELRNRYFNELGATKLACVWVLEHLGKTKGKSRAPRR